MARKKWYSIEKDALQKLAEYRQFRFLKTLALAAASPVAGGQILIDGRLLQRLTAAGLLIQKVRTDYEGVLGLLVEIPTSERETSGGSRGSRGSRGSHSVRVLSWDGELERTEVAKQVQEILLPVVKQDIHIGVPHGQVQPPATMGFNIWIWSSPARGAGEIACPRRMWGTKVPCTDQGDEFGCPGPEFLPLHSSEGDLVGCMDQHNLYLFWDAPHHSRDGLDVPALHILSCFFKEAAKFFASAGKPVPQELIARLFVEARKRYVQVCRNRSTLDRKQASKDLEALNVDLERNRANMMELSRQIESCEKVLASDPVEDDPKKYELEYDALCKLPKVKEVKCTPTTLSVTTDTIYVQHSKNKTWYKIGKFKISVGLDIRSEHVIRMINLDGRVDNDVGNMNAPHVFDDGRPCLGNIERAVRELLRKHEYAALIQLLLVFLSTANLADGAGSQLTKWPRVSAEEATGKKAEKPAKPAKLPKEKKDAT